MPNSLPMTALHEAFQKQAMDLRMVLGEAGTCVVSKRVLYQMPDTPSLLQEYVAQQDDMFEPGLPLIQHLNAFEARIAKANKLTELLDIYEAWAQFAEEAKEQLNDESWLYLRPIKIHIQTQDREVIAKNMERIPFPNTRKILIAWAKTIDGLPREVHLDARPTTFDGVTQKSAGLMHAQTYSVN